MKYTIGFVLGLALAFLAVRMLAERGVFYNVADDADDAENARTA